MGHLCKQCVVCNGCINESKQKWVQSVGKHTSRFSLPKTTFYHLDCITITIKKEGK